jgi:hypothetical protein
VEKGMEHTIQIFMDTLREVVEKYEFEIFIHPVVPVLNETRSLVIQYNRIFKDRVDASKRCKWLDFFDDLIEGSPPKVRYSSSRRRRKGSLTILFVSCHQLQSQYELDGTHLHPNYLALLERELAKHM